MPNRVRSIKSESRQSSCGKVPNDWKVLPIGKVTTLCQYGLSVASETSGNVPILGMKDLVGGKVLLNNLGNVSISLDDVEKCRLKRNDILLNRTNSYDLVGKVGIFDSDELVVFASYLVRFQFNQDVIPEFVNYCLNSYGGQQTLRRLATRGVSQANINPTVFRENFLLPIPPIDEQKKIAEILGTWDEAIGTIEHLIEHQQKQKQAMMQKLLTGQFRFQQFREKDTTWQSGNFADIAEIIMGQSPDGSTYNQEEVGTPLINGPTEFNERYPTKIQWTTQPTKKCEVGDILLCVRGSSTGRINIANDEYCIGRGIAAIRAKVGKSCTSYLEQQLTYGLQNILKLTAGSTFPNIDKKSIGKIAVEIPSLLEQKEIALVLSLNDEKSHLLRTQLQELQAQKQGLMQQLLTGKLPVKTGRVK
jgi:type I restriction enzyme, S subunit